MEFSFNNVELKEWITFVDVGSEQIKLGMNEGDSTISAITDGMRKCASRIGVASDIYKGMITWDKQRQAIIVPDHYQRYYEENGLASKSMEPVQQFPDDNNPANNRKKAETQTSYY